MDGHRKIGRPPSTLEFLMNSEVWTVNPPTTHKRKFKKIDQTKRRMPETIWTMYYKGFQFFGHHNIP
jgi:hypothetical protein